MFYLGLAAFALFFLGDLNDWTLKKDWLRPCFFVGVALLAVSTGGLCFVGASPLPLHVRILFWVLALVCAGQVLYAVLSVTFKAGRGDKKTVYSGELYSLCRHPGALGFVPMYICLHFACGFPIFAAAVFCVLNLLLIVFEDTLVFPSLLDGYDRYKLTIPFIIPTADSFRAFLGNKYKDGIS